MTESHTSRNWTFPFEAVANAERTAAQNASSVTFSRTQPGNFSDWHTAPRRQYVITLEGQMEVGLGDGTKRIFNSGDVLLADDLTGRRAHHRRPWRQAPRLDCGPHHRLTGCQGVFIHRRRELRNAHRTHRRHAGDVLRGRRLH